MKRLYILGAGASADFCPSSYSRGYPLNENSFTPFPTTNNFFQKSIEFGKLNKADSIFKFIEQRYNISFENIKNGVPLDIERVYNDIYEYSKTLDIENNQKDVSSAWVLLWSIQDIIEELPQHYFTVYGPCENYSIFAKHIVETSSAVISFNWDTFLDEALTNTGKWFYKSGYGFKFERIYSDRKQIDRADEESSVLLLKPHGSINWFRYRDYHSSKTDGFTNVPVDDEDRAKVFLMLFSRNKIEHPIHRRLHMAKELTPPLKMPCRLDIIYPSKTNHSLVRRITYDLIRDKMKLLFKEADEIIFIGFAFKQPDTDEFDGVEVKDAAEISLVNIDQSKELMSRYEKVFKKKKISFSPEKTFKQYCASLMKTGT